MRTRLLVKASGALEMRCAVDNAKLPSKLQLVLPSLCVLLVGLLCGWWYSQGIAGHLTLFSGDVLWRAVMHWLSRFIWLGLGMLLGSMLPKAQQSKRWAGIILMLVGALVFIACGAFRILAEFSPEVGGIYLYLTLSQPFELLYLLAGGILGYGVKLSIASSR